MRTRFTEAIVDMSARFELEADLVEAVVIVESGGHPGAWNPEPKYRYFWDVRRNKPFRKVTALEVASEIPPPDFPFLAGDRDQEWWAQQASWGLMQVMGAVARERGYRDPYLPTLVRDELEALRAGCQHLALQIRWAGGDVERALAAYNGGQVGNEVRPLRNAEYAAKVLAAKASL